MPRRALLTKLLRYKQWSSRLAFDAVMAVSEEEAFKPRQTTFGNMVHTLNHIYVIDDIFRHHLLGTRHAYTARNTQQTPTIVALREQAQAIEQWYLDHVAAWSDTDLDMVVVFEFVGGGEGRMTKEDIILHIVNHTTYHRGFVGDMLKQIPHEWRANDYPVFLREEG